MYRFLPLVARQQAFFRSREFSFTRPLKNLQISHSINKSRGVSPTRIVSFNTPLHQSLPITFRKSASVAVGINSFSTGFFRQPKNFLFSSNFTSTFSFFGLHSKEDYGKRHYSEFKEIDSMFEDVEYLYLNRNYKATLALCNILLEHYPWVNYEFSTTYKIKSLTELGKFEEAIIVVDKILTLESLNYRADFLNLKGAILNAQKKYSEAIEYFEKAHVADPDYIDPLQNKGVVLLQEDRLEEALNCLNKASVQFQAQSKYSNAENIFDILLNRFPDNPGILFNKGLMLQEQHKYEKAITYYDKALHFNPLHVGSLNNKGNIFITLKRYDQAAKCFEQVISLDSQHVDAINNMGLLLANQGQYDQAIEYFNKVLTINPEHKKAFLNKENIYKAIKGNELSIAYFTNDKKLRKLMELGLSYASSEKYEAALDCFKQVLTVEHYNISALSNCGLALIELNQFDQALYYLDQAIEIEPYDFATLNNKGLLYMRQKMYEEALPYFEKAASIAPNNDVTRKNKQYCKDKLRLSSHSVGPRNPIK